METSVFFVILVNLIFNEAIMEMIIVAIIIALAFVYVSRNLYRQLRGKGGCSSGCSCTPEIKHHCCGMTKSLDNRFE